jgi:hypothetical protein
LGEFYLQIVPMDQPTIELIRMYLLLAKSHFEEALRICMKIFGPSNKGTENAELQLANVLKMITVVNESESEYYSTLT